MNFPEFSPALPRLALILVPGLPLVCGLACLVWTRRLHRLSAWAALPALAVALLAPVGVREAYSWFLLDVRLGVDETGRVFLLFTALLWLLAGMFGGNYLAEDRHRGRFFFFFHLSMSGNLGLILAQDMAGFYLFFALMSFASYGLVIHNGDASALRAGRIYLSLVVVGEVLLFSAVVILFNLTGSLDLPGVAHSPANKIVLPLVLLGFGIKAGSLPLHVWLPLAHPASPTPASAVLSGAMIKAGLLCWIRFLPLGEAALPEWGAVCVMGGVLAAFFGVLVGVVQTHPKTVLAYSSISQMGFMTVGIGVGLLRADLWPLAQTAVVIYALHHAFAKGTLFLGAGVAGGVLRHGRARWWFVLGLVLPALSLAGAPFTSGMVAKIALKSAVAGLPEPWSACLASLLPLAAAGTTCLMIRFLFIVLRDLPGEPHAVPGLWLPWTAMILLTALTAWLLPEAQSSVRNAWSLSAFVKAVWPVALGGLAALAAFFSVQGKVAKRIPQIPAGDILALGAWVAAGCEQIRKRHVAPWRKAAGIKGGEGRALILKAVGKARLLGEVERSLSRWSSVGTVLLLLSLVFGFLVFLSPG